MAASLNFAFASESESEELEEDIWPYKQTPKAQAIEGRTYFLRTWGGRAIIEPVPVWYNKMSVENGESWVV